MAKFVIKKPVITVDGSDLTNRISQVTVDMPDDEVDMTTFGSDFKETDVGMSDASMALNFYQDYAKTTGVDVVLWPLKKESKKFIVAVQPFEGEPSEENPCYVMGAKMFGYTPLSGSVGEASNTEPTFKNQTQLGIERVAPAEGDKEEKGKKAREKAEEEIEKLFV